MPMFSKYAATIPKIVKLYDSGLSWREVGARVGLTHTTCSRLYAKMGRKSRGKPGAPRTKYNGAWFYLKRSTGYWVRRVKSGSQQVTLYLHRVVYETEVGPIPEGYEIHHVDMDKGNNHVNNLQCVSHEEHEALHGRGFRRLHGSKEESEPAGGAEQDQGALREDAQGEAGGGGHGDHGARLED